MWATPWLKWLQRQRVEFCHAPAQAPPAHLSPAAGGRPSPSLGLAVRAGAPLRPLPGGRGLGPGLGQSPGRRRLSVPLRHAPACADLDQLYAKRWTIEQCFQNLKGRGFNLEATHLRCRQKLRKLVALVSLAYALCLSVGTVAHEKIKPIARKNHGYRATSLSRHGLNILRQLTRPHTPATRATSPQNYRPVRLVYPTTCLLSNQLK
ncbi:MAG: transposase [Hymenobacter sp.]